jgi:hypothetical protein
MEIKHYSECWIQSNLPSLLEEDDGSGSYPSIDRPLKQKVFLVPMIFSHSLPIVEPGDYFKFLRTFVDENPFKTKNMEFGEGFFSYVPESIFTGLPMQVLTLEVEMDDDKKNVAVVPRGEVVIEKKGLTAIPNVKGYLLLKESISFKSGQKVEKKHLIRSYSGASKIEIEREKELFLRDLAKFEETGFLRLLRVRRLMC